MALTRAKCVSWATIALCLALSSVAGTPAGASTLSSGPFCCRNAPPWRGVAGFGPGRDAGFNDIAAISRNDAWAVGGTGLAAPDGVAVHWNGKHWRPVPVPVKNFVPVSVSARPGSSAWVFGYQENAGSDVAEFPAYGLERVRGVWQVHRLPSYRAQWTELGDLQSTVISNDDVWITGNGLDSLSNPTDDLAWNWTGSGWIRYSLHVSGVRYISGSSGGNVWVAGAGSAWPDVRAALERNQVAADPRPGSHAGERRGGLCAQRLARRFSHAQPHGYRCCRALERHPLVGQEPDPVRADY